MDGNFVLNNIPVGRHNILITYISYKDISISNLEINSGKEVILNIEMEESTVVLNDVTVKAHQNKATAMNELNPVSARTFSIEETGRYAGSRNDISRMAANYAGVSNSNDSRNDIVIRGNSPLGLLWRLEGLEIPNPNHFSTMGSNGGPISMLNYNVIANSDFMTGAFPAEYGNATSGVFDLKLRNGNNHVRESLFQFGALGTEFMLEGPVSKESKGSYLVNYRFSTTSILTLLGIDFGYSGQANYHQISQSVFEFGWIAEHVILVAEGVFMYCSGQDVKKLFLSLQEKLNNPEIVFEVFYSKWLTGWRKKVMDFKLKKELKLGEGTTFKFGIPDSDWIESWNQGLQLIDDWSYIDSDELNSSFMKLFRNSSSFRKVQWTVHYKLNKVK